MKSIKLIDQVYGSKVIRTFLLIIMYPALFGLLSAITNFYVLKYLAFALGKVINSLELTVYTIYRCIPVVGIGGVLLAIAQSLVCQEKIKTALLSLVLKTTVVAWVIMAVLQYLFLPLD